MSKKRDNKRRVWAALLSAKEHRSLREARSPLLLGEEGGWWGWSRSGELRGFLWDVSREGVRSGGCRGRRSKLWAFVT